MKMSSSKVRSLVASCILGDARLGAKPGRIGDRRAGGSDAERGNVDRADRFHIRREDAKRETARWRVTRASVFASALSPEWRAPVSDDVPSTTASRSFARLGARRREGRWRGIMRRSLSAVARRLAARRTRRVPRRASPRSRTRRRRWRFLNRGAPSRASSPPRPPHAPHPQDHRRVHPFRHRRRPPSRLLPRRRPRRRPVVRPRRRLRRRASPPASQGRPAASHRARADHLPGQRRVPPPPPPRRGTPSAPDGTRRHPREDGNPRATPQRPLRRLRRRRRARRRRRRPRDDPSLRRDVPAATESKTTATRSSGIQLPTPISIRVTSSTLGWCTSFTTPRRIPNRHPGCGDWRRRSGSPWRRTPRRSAAIGARTRSIRARSRTPRTTPSCRSGSRGDNTRGTLRVTCRSPIGPRVSRDVRVPRILDARAADRAEIVPACRRRCGAQFRRFANRRPLAAGATREAADRFIRIAQTLARHDARGGDAPGRRR